MLGQRGCRLLTGVVLHGYDAVLMENRRLAIWVLPGKGSDIVQFLYKPRDVDVTWSTVWGLRQNAGVSRDFVGQYEGGWQEIFPNGGMPSDYQGARLGQHDEVARLPWQWRVVEDTASRVSIRLTVELVKTPFRLEKLLTLESESGLLISETVTNLSSTVQSAMWGHHLAFGPPFLSSNTQIETTARTVIVTDEPIAPRRYRAGSYSWPWVLGVEGSRHDLSRVPKRDGTRDIVYLTDFDTGGYRLFDPDCGLAFSASWDAHVLPYCWYWQELGASGYPWYGRHYNIGLEPFGGYPTHGLGEAMENGSALQLRGEEVRCLDMVLDVRECHVDSSLGARDLRSKD